MSDDFEVVGYKGSAKEECGIIFSPYSTQVNPEIRIEGVRDDAYSKFMESYRQQHKYCPNCGDENYMSTLVAYIYIVGKEDEYQDLNNARCKCGHEHTVHDRVASPYKTWC